MAKFQYRESPTEKQKKAFSPYLSEDEELILVTGMGRVYIRQKLVLYIIFPGLIFGAILFGVGFALGFNKIHLLAAAILVAILVGILKAMHLYHANRYLLTTRRVIIKKGLFSVKLTAAMYDKITHLEVDQSFIDRILLHHGTIIINTAGVHKDEIILRFVDYPMELKNLLERLITREREHLGLQSFSGATVEGEIL